MNRSMSWLALASGLGALLLLGCNKPCETTNQCGSGEVCAGALCQALACEAAMFATDPQSGACVALSGCFLTPEQRAWKTCSTDPCIGLAEPGCLSDARCQPAYENPDIVPQKPGDPQVGFGACVVQNGGIAPTPNGPDGASAPGVNNGQAPKHPSPSTFSCFPNNARNFVACRAVPQIAKRAECATLSKDPCGQRADCTTDPGTSTITRGGPVPPVPTPVPPGLGADGSSTAGPGVCFARVPRTLDCATADAVSCMTNPECQVIGGKGFCPPNASCDHGGDFAFCEPNDRLRRCHTLADCKGGERCDNDEACITPRTYSAIDTQTQPVPGTGSCLGACVPSGCAGYGENYCSDHPECDAGTYATVCHPKPYCSGGPMLPPGDPGPIQPGTQPDPNNPIGNNCGCDNEFVGCGPQPANVPGGVHPDRSLLVRDPEILSDPAFRIDTVLGSLAPAGQGDLFVQKWLQLFGKSTQLSNGAIAVPRPSFDKWLSQRGQISLGLLKDRFHTTSLVNRLDLASATDCGEARITFALDDGYVNGDNRMTIIVELRVPDDGAHCRTVAQRWAELTLVDDVKERLTRLQSLYKELLVPAHLGQIRTNEFINLTGAEPWELREWHLNAQGFLDLAPVKQTVSPILGQDPSLLGWVRDNMAAIKTGTVVVPDKFLAAASRENGGRVQLPGSEQNTDLKAAEDGLNKLSCSGCHLTETKSPFVHVGERLGKAQGGGFIPSGRAVIDTFLQKELQSRAKNLQSILSAQPAAQDILPPWRQLIQTRVH